MHEWALAEAVLEATASVLRDRSPAGQCSVTVLIGELQAIDREIFRFALSQMMEGWPFPKTVFHLETEPASFQCLGCSHEWTLNQVPGLDEESREAIHFLPESAHAFLRCPACSSPDYRILMGRGVSIGEIAIEGEQVDD